MCELPSQSPQPNVQVMDSPRKRQKLAMTGFDGASDVPDQDAVMEASREADQVPPTPQSEGDNKTAVAQALKETEVGITEYVNADLVGFSGIVKKRFV
jgi:tRNA pseudouridine13 synthase